MNPDWISGILIAFSAQSLVLAGALAWTTPNPVADRCLALVLVVLVGMTSVYLFGWTGRVEVAPALAFAPFNLPIALGPLLYGYVHGLVHGRGPRHAILHHLPAIILFAYLMTALLLPADLRLAWKDGIHDKMIKPVIEGAVLASLTGYSLAGLDLLRRYRTWLEQVRSDADRYGAKWIGWVLLALLTTLGLLSGVRLYTWFVGEVDSGPVQLWLAAFGALAGVQGWRCSGCAFPQMEALPGPVTDASQNWGALGRDWQATTQAEGWWREQALTLADLARRLGTNTSYLSRAINDGLGVNFNEMINRMRAEEVARRIDAGDAAPLTHLALESGFSSKATFNRAFRAVYGISPSARRRMGQIPN